MLILMLTTRLLRRSITLRRLTILTLLTLRNRDLTLLRRSRGLAIRGGAATEPDLPFGTS